MRQRSGALRCNPAQSRRRRQRPAGCAGCNFNESAQLDSQLADSEAHVLVRNRLELSRRFFIERPCTLEITALRVKDRDGGLDQSLVEKFRVAVGALPDFLPRFMTLKEPPLIKELDSALVKIWTRHTIRCSEAMTNGNGTVRNFGSSIRTARYSSVSPESRIAWKLSNHTSATPS